jgi:murein DD-endopeptidase MepM/ murein hydrolase activator NlpD
MPVSPALDRALRPLALATLAAGVLTALAASESHAAAPVAAVVSAAPTARVGHPTPDPVGPTGIGLPQPPHVSAPSPARASRGHHRALRPGEWLRPVAGPVTSRFGRRWGGFHPGIDIGARYGARVHAITTGRIISAGWIPGYGKIVRVRSGRYTFFYPHLSRIWRRHGIIREGQVLGRVGSTGFSTGPHLHIEIRMHGRPVNPAPVLRRHGVRL